MAPEKRNMAPEKIDVSQYRATICDVCKGHAEKSQDPVYKSCKDMYESSSIKAREDDTVNFECSICWDVCQDPVVTMCGHLFCWSCLNSWLSLHSISKECPVCKTNVEGKIVRMYRHGKVCHPKSMTENFSGIHTSSCRSSSDGGPSIPQITQAISGYGGHLNNSIWCSEMHTIHAAHSAQLGFFASLLTRFGLACLDLGNVGDAGVGFFCRCAWTNAASLLAQTRRRLINEKQFVLNWVFICVASVAIVYFLTY